MSKTFSSRLRRFEEKRLRTRLILAVVGCITLLVLLAVFGFRLFIGFTLLLGQMQGAGPETQAKSKALVIPPYLDPLPMATPSGKLIITGRGQPNASLVLFVDDDESKTVPISEEGTFIISSITLPEGNHTLRAKTEDSKGNKSEFSNAVHTTIKRKPPVLEVNKPTDNSTVNGEDNLLSIEGKTEEETDVRVNDRFVVVQPDGTFTYPYPLQDGANELKIKAIDRAGNSTIVTRHVTYQK